MPCSPLFDIQRLFLVSFRSHDQAFWKAEFLDDLLDQVHAGAGVAVLDVAADDILAAGEDAVLRIGVEAYDLLLIDVGEVHGHVLVDEVDLLEGHLSRS